MSAADRMHAHMAGMSGGLLSDDMNASYDIEADNASSVSGFVGASHQSPPDHLDYPPPMNRQPHRFSVRIGSIAAASRDQRGVIGGVGAGGSVAARRGLAMGQPAAPSISQQPPPPQRSLAASCGGSNNNSASQLHDAAASGDVVRVRHLVFEAGVTPDFSDDSGRTPLHCAAMTGQLAVVELLLKTGCNVDGEDCDGSPPLYYAARYGHFEVVRCLLARGCPATVDKQNFDTGNTAVHEAAARGFSQTLKLLIHAKANIAIVNKELNTPLHLAAQYGHNQCSRILLYAGAVVESRNNHGDTVLHVAARCGSAGVVRVLLAGVLGGGSAGMSGAMSMRGGVGGGNVNYGALLSSTNRNMDTPLHLSAANRHRNVVRLLLDAGADPALRNRAGDTPAQVSSRKGFSDIATMIASFMRMGGPQSSHMQQQQAWLMQQPPTSPAPGAYPNDFNAWPQQQQQENQQQSAPFFNLVPSTRPGVKQAGSNMLTDPYANGTGSLRYCQQHQSGGRSTDGLFYYPDGRMPQQGQQQQGRQVPMGYPGTVAPMSYAARPMMQQQPQQQMGYPMQQHQMLFAADSQAAGIHMLGGGYDGMMGGGQVAAPNGNTKKSGKDSTSSGKQVAFAPTKPANKSGKSMFSWVERRFDALVTKLSHFKGSSKTKGATAIPAVPPNAAEEILQQGAAPPQILFGTQMDDPARVTLQRGAQGYRQGLDADGMPTRPPLPSHAFMQQQQQQQQMAFRQPQAGSYRGAPPQFMQQQQLHNIPPFDHPQPLFQQPPQQQMYRQQHNEQNFYQQNQRPQQQAPRLYRTRSDDTLSVSDYKCQTWKKYHRALRAVDDTAFATDAAVRLHQQQIMRMCPAAPRPTSASETSISSGGSVMSGPIAADRAEQLLAAKRNRGGTMPLPSHQNPTTGSVSSNSGSQGHPPAVFHPTSAASECSHSGIAPLNSGSTSNPQSKSNSENVTAHSSPNEMDATTRPQGGIIGMSDAEDIDTASVLDHQPCITESFKKQDGNSPSSVNASTPAKIVLSFLKGIANNAAQVRRPIADIQPSAVQGQMPSAGAALAASGDSESAENEMVFQSNEKYLSGIVCKPPSGAASYSGYSSMHVRCSASSAIHPQQKMTGSTSSSNAGMCVSAMSIGAHDSQSPSGASNQSSGYESVKIAAQFLMAAPSRPTATSTPEKNIISSARGMSLPPHQRPELSPIETPRRCASPLHADSPAKTPVGKSATIGAVLKKSPSKSENNFGVVVFANPMPVMQSPLSPAPAERAEAANLSIEEQENRDIEKFHALPILPRPVPAPVPSSNVFTRYCSSLSSASSVYTDNQYRALSYNRLGSASATASVHSSPVRSLLQTASTNPYATVRAPVIAGSSPSRHLASVFDANADQASTCNGKTTVTSQV